MFDESPLKHLITQLSRALFSNLVIGERKNDGWCAIHN